MLEIIIPEILSSQPELICGISTKAFGSLRAIDDNDNNEIFKNREKFADKLDFNPNKLIVAGVSHSSNICLVKREQVKKTIDNCDCLITNEAGIFLMITMADCLPIFIFEPQIKVCGLMHAGWRSLKVDIIKKTIQTAVESFDIKVKDLLVYIGPGISLCHFEVKDDVARLFQREFLVKKQGKVFIDLKAVAKTQLLSLGVDVKNIEISQDCTFCQVNKYFSYRRDRPKILQAMGAVIGLK